MLVNYTITGEIHQMEEQMKKVMLIVIGLSVFLSCAVTYSWAEIPRDGLVAEYLFDANANDTSGNGHNGTVNGATLASDRFGRSGKAYKFVGSNSNTISTSFIPPNTFTISLWYNASPTQRENAGIASTYSTGRYDGFYYPHGGTWEAIRTNGNRINDISQVNVNQWTHLLIASANSRVKVYKNGSLILDIPSTTTHADTIIFGSSRFNGKYFTGYIDDIRIYNRALSADEISKLYHEGVLQISAFFVSPNAGSAPLTVDFTCRATSPNGSIAQYLWDVNGDGYPDEITTVGHLTYTYTSDGTYNPRVQVVDSTGASTKSDPIKVTVGQGPELYGEVEYYEYNNVAKTIHAKVRVYNTGNVAASLFKVSFAVSDNGKGPTVFKIVQVPGLASLQDALLDISYTFPESIYARVINIAIDANRKVAEVDETNNGAKILIAPSVTK